MKKAAFERLFNGDGQCLDMRQNRRRRHILRGYGYYLPVSGDNDRALLVFLERQHGIVSRNESYLKLLIDLRSLGSFLLLRHRI